MDWVLIIILIFSPDAGWQPGPREVGHLATEADCAVAGEGMTRMLVAAYPQTIWGWSCNYEGPSS